MVGTTVLAGQSLAGSLDADGRLLVARPGNMGGLHRAFRSPDRGRRPRDRRGASPRRRPGAPQLGARSGRRRGSSPRATGGGGPWANPTSRSASTCTEFTDGSQTLVRPLVRRGRPGGDRRLGPGHLREERPLRGLRLRLRGPRADDGPGTTDIFLRDLATNETTLVSRATGTAGAAGTRHPPRRASRPTAAMSRSPRTATNFSVDNKGRHPGGLRPGPLAGTTTLVSGASGAAGAAADNDALAPAISRDGRSVAFESLAANLGPDGSREADGGNGRTTSATWARRRRRSSAGGRARTAARQRHVDGALDLGRRPLRRLHVGRHRLGAGMRRQGAEPPRRS